MTTIVVIGEDEAFCKKTGAFLHVCGNDILIINDPKNFTEALNDTNLKNTGVDIIFIDSNKMLTKENNEAFVSEIEAIKKLREEGNKTPIVFITHENNAIVTTICMKKAGLYHIEGDIHVIEENKLEKEVLKDRLIERLTTSNPLIGKGESGIKR